MTLKHEAINQIPLFHANPFVHNLKLHRNSIESVLKWTILKREKNVGLIASTRQCRQTIILYDSRRERKKLAGYHFKRHVNDLKQERYFSYGHLGHEDPTQPIVLLFPVIKIMLAHQKTIFDSFVPCLQFNSCQEFYIRKNA